MEVTPVFDVDPEGRRLPIKLDSTSNGEFSPIPLDATLRRANALADETASRNARRLGKSRREFLVSTCGAASTLLAFNSVHAAAGRTGGFFELSAEAALDGELAAAELGKREFIFDVQGHFVNPDGAWLKRVPAGARPLSQMPKAACGLANAQGERAYLRCLGSQEFIKDVFLDSDTDMMVLSFVPSQKDREPLTIEEAAATRDIVERLEGTHRLMLHGRVNPNQPGDIEDMERLKQFGVVAWKTYTQFGPGGRGFFMTDEAGIRFVERARQLGVKNICIHKGIPFGRESYEHSTCADIGPIAKRFPDVNFLIYHSGWVPDGEAEGPYDPARTDGIDALVTSLQKADVKPNANVYAELGSTWRFLALRKPDEAAHALGKLFKHVGHDNVLWGTDSIWYGSPQDQIQAFRSFQIAPELRDKHGYPEITPALRQKVFATNAAKPYKLSIPNLQQRTIGDAVARERVANERPNPSFRTYGPRTRREFLNLAKWGGA
ncbi:MAG TPA: amidohydrolase family protein [Steroidobacteraceae bacterium]|nr:amidohydrolase family protein [Steroidobacteraceae bacterium]